MWYHLRVLRGYPNRYTSRYPYQRDYWHQYQIPDNVSGAYYR